MKILVTGAAGYLGSVLVPMLLDAGHGIYAYDNLMYRNGRSLAACFSSSKFKFVRGDVTHSAGILESLVRDADVVVHLAAIVGAPACARNPNWAWRVNHGSVVDLLNMMEPHQRLVFPNTNSGYGKGGIEPCVETDPLRPVSEYGRAKVAAEKLVREHRPGSSTVFRFATLFGASPRMRVDLLVNDFVRRAVADGYLALYEPEARRNYLHVKDAARAVLWACETNIGPGIYNCGLSDANLNKRQLCQIIAKVVPGFHFTEMQNRSDPDQRDYLVSNAKIAATGWKPVYTLVDGIIELARFYQCDPCEGQDGNG